MFNNTNEEEVLDKSQDTEVEEAAVNDESQDTENQEGQDKEPDKTTDKPDDAKERNRKGYELRKGKEKPVSREEFESVQNSVSKITEENTDLKFRQIHPEITDEAFNSLKALSKGSGKNYEESLKDPAIQALLDATKSKAKVDNATAEPSTRTASASSNDYANMPLAEISKKAQEVRGRL